MLVQHTFVRGSTRLGYGEGPASGPPLVLLHGLMEDRRSFEPLLPSLCVHHHVFALDLRGHGTSDWTPGAYALTDDAEDALALLAERLPPRPALLGHSQGALIGIAVASRIAADLAALVLVDPPLPCLADERASIARVIDLFRSIRALLVDTGGGAAGRAAMLERFPGAELMADQTSKTDPERIASVIDMSAFEGPRWPDLLTRITCPTLLLQADPARGAALSDEDAGAALEVLADGRLVCMSGAGHMIQDDAPDAYAREVLEFLAERR